MAEQVKIQWLEETDSTQNAFLGHFSEYDNMSVVAAGFQTAGRGQRGNTWLAGKGENLTFSMLLKFGDGDLPSLKAADQFGITRAATLGVATYLKSKDIDCSIKWPNDIYVRNKKICGMLIENVLSGNYLKASVVGIGLNVNQKEFPPQLVNPTSMSVLTGKHYSLTRELEYLCEILSRFFTQDMGGPGQVAAYEDMLYQKGTFHNYVRCSDVSAIKCRIVGTTAGGKLIAENEKGELEEFAFKEISYII